MFFFNTDGKIDFATFLDVMYQHSQTEKCQQEIMAAFTSHDKHGKGYVPAAELMQILTSFGERLTRQEGFYLTVLSQNCKHQ